MPTRQKVILAFLILLSAVQQGVRWSWARPEVALAQTGEMAVAAQERHCPLVHVNTAGMAELLTLPGIGPVFAERMIMERRERPFLEKRDLLRVSGIGEKRLAQIADLICLYFEEDAES